MKRCIERRLGQLAFLYQMGVLNNRVRYFFEAHLLECDFCFERLNRLEPIVLAVRHHRAAIIEGLECYGTILETNDDQSGGSSATRRHHTESPLQRIKEIFGKWRQTMIWASAAITAVTIVGYRLLLWSPPVPVVEDPREIADFTRSSLLFDETEYRGTHMSPDARMLFRDGLKKYAQGDDESAIDRIRAALDQAPQEGTWCTCLGILYHLHHEPMHAIETLQKAKSLTEFCQKDQAGYYLAQAYLTINRPDSAIFELDSIIAHGERSPYFGRANTQRDEILEIKAQKGKGKQ